MIYKHDLVPFVNEGDHRTEVKIGPDLLEERQPTAYRNLRLAVQNLAVWNVNFLELGRKTWFTSWWPRRPFALLLRGRRHLRLPEVRDNLVSIYSVMYHWDTKMSNPSPRCWGDTRFPSSSTEPKGRGRNVREGQRTQPHPISWLGEAARTACNLCCTRRYKSGESMVACTV